MGSAITRLQPEEKEGRIIQFKTNKEIKLKKDGTAKQTPCNAVKGDPHEVYPIKKKEEIEAVKDYFRTKRDNAANEEDKHIAGRYLMMFCIAINLGLRFSDLLTLKWGDIFFANGEFREGIRRSEQKTSKFKTFFLNQACKNAIAEYVEDFKPRTYPQLYIFESRQGGVIGVRTACKVLQEAANSVGIKQKIGSHSCRKTFSYWFLMSHKEDVMALTYLQNLLNHSSQKATLHYAGIADENTKQYYDDINL